MPWVERYRPRILKDVVGNEDTIVRLRAIAEDGNMPNLILCGPPGTGKVGFIVRVAKRVPCVPSRLTKVHRQLASMPWHASYWALIIARACLSSMLPTQEELMLYETKSRVLR